MNKTEHPIERIFIVGPTESALTRRGNRHPTLALYFVDHGFSVEYLTTNFYHATKTHFTQEEIDRVRAQIPYKMIVFKRLGYKKNISVTRVFSSFSMSIKAFLYLWPKLDRNSLLMLPSRPVELIFAAAMLRLLKKNSLLLDIQDVWPDALKSVSLWKRLIFRIYCNVFLYPSVRFYDRFVHVTPSFVNWLKRYAPAASSEFIPLGIDAARWPGDMIDTIDTVHDPLVLIYVGMLQYQIDILPVVQALVGRNDARLIIIGDSGQGERYPRVKQFVDKNHMENVEFQGFIEPMELPQHLKKADIGLIPIISSLLPNKFFDYIAAYKPILVLGETNDCALLTRQLDIGWVIPYSREGVQLFLDEIKAQKVIEKRYKIKEIKEKFSRDKLYLKFLEVVKRPNRL